MKPGVLARPVAEHRPVETAYELFDEDAADDERERRAEARPVRPGAAERRVRVAPGRRGDKPVRVESVRLRKHVGTAVAFSYAYADAPPFGDHEARPPNVLCRD